MKVYLVDGWRTSVEYVIALPISRLEGEEGVRSHLPRRNYRGSTQGEEGMRQSDQFVLDGTTSCGTA